MKKFFNVLAICTLSLSLLIIPTVQPAHAYETDRPEEIYNEDGTIIQALQAEEIEAVLADGIEFKGQAGQEPSEFRHKFDDGSAFVVTSSLVEMPSEERGIQAYESRKEKKMKARTSYSVENWSGDKLWEYILYQDFKTNGMDITWFAKAPYSDFEKTNFLVSWSIESEGNMYTDYAEEGDGITAYTNPKLTWTFGRIVDIQRITLLGELTVEGNGYYHGKWKKIQ